MSASNDQRPSGVLVIDGERMALARTPDDVAPLTRKRLVDGGVSPEAVLIASMAEPRRQRTGTQAFAAGALRDLPFYAFAEGCAADSHAALEAARTPFDRTLQRGEATAPDTLAVADGAVATLLSAVFADLAAQAMPPAERLAARWRFGDVKSVLAARLGQLARRSARANRPLRLVHTRCGDGAWSLAVAPPIAYFGVDDRSEARAAGALWPQRTILAPDALASAIAGEAGLFLLSDVAADDDLAALLAPLGAVAAREAVVIGIIPHGAAGNAEHGIIDEPRINRLATALQGAFAATAELRRLETLAHKPLDALPGTTLVEFEVTR